MDYRKTITFLVIVIIIMSTIASSVGIFSEKGTGAYEYNTIRGETIEIYGKGIYKHMSSDVAIQGIAQDYITLFFAVPLLVIAVSIFRKDNLKGKFILSGTLLYFLLTYMFYMAMAMFNQLFLIYAILITSSFFAFVLSIISFDIQKVKKMIKSEKIPIIAGWFLIFNSLVVALMWICSILKPLISGTLYPQGLDHYTTMIVQGFDLGLFLPIGFVSGLLAIKRNTWGMVFSTVYVIFLSILMLALSSKILFMANAGANVIPVIFIMPSICVVSMVLSLLLMKNIQKNEAIN